MSSLDIESPALLEGAVADRSLRLFRENQNRIYVRTDRLFAGLMIIQWIACIAAAFLVSPQTWTGVESRTHIHVWFALLVGGLLSLFPVYLALTCPGAALTRHVIAIGQMLTSALLIHLTGGRIETHFHVFGSLAFLACYRDWRVLVSATVVVTADHFLRGVYFPQSVFGVATANSLRVLEHAGWVIFENVFLIVAIRQNVQEMREMAQQRAQLETTKEVVELEVRRRTKQLDETNHQLLASKEIAEAASRAKSEFLANMSHEIRTPMTAILGFIDIILDRLDDPEAIQAADTVKDNGQYLIQLINDILDLSKIESGKLSLEQVACSPQEIVADVVSLMKVRSDAKGLRLKARLVNSIPDAILSDPTRLRQVLINVVGNAIKFTENGEVELQVLMLEDHAGQPSLRFEVRDEGIGIPADRLDSLFLPFTQADSSTTRKFGGTGLGLAISNRLVELLGGEIKVTSTPGQGSTFTIDIPANEVESAAIDSPPERQSRPRRKESPAKPQVTCVEQECRVLLAEDGPDNQRLISFFLKKAGAEVTLAQNGAIAVERALEAASSKTPFHLILMDMQMPVLDGYQATQNLRSAGYDGPIIALTAHAMNGDREKCLEAGCDDYATKPIDRAELDSFVSQYGASKSIHA